MANLHQFTTILNIYLVPWTETEPYIAITNQLEESEEKDNDTKEYKESNLG